MYIMKKKMDMKYFTSNNIIMHVQLCSSSVILFQHQQRFNMTVSYLSNDITKSLMIICKGEAKF